LMRKLGFALAMSVLVNMFLAGWLVAQYFNDVFFRGYVDQFFGVNSTYIILTIGVGGGSTLGYIFLRRKGHVDHSMLSGLGRTKGLKADEGIRSPAFASQVKPLPAGAPPMQPSKHTAYAVPPISKGPSPSTFSSQKGAPSTAWTSASKTISRQPSSPPTLASAPRQVTPSPIPMDRTRQPPASSSFESRPGPPMGSSQTSIPPGPSSIPSQFGKPPSVSMVPSQRADQFSPPRQQSDTRLGLEATTPRWTPDQRSTTQGSEPGFSPARPIPGGFTSGETGLKRVPIQGVGPSPQPSSQPPAQSSVPTAKWQPPDSASRPNFQAPSSQWVSPVPKQSYNPGPRPGPPGSAFPGQRPQSPPGVPMRPGQAAPPRPLFPPGQNTPRPLAYPGAPRPTQPGQGAPGSFRQGLVVTGPQGSGSRSVASGEGPGQRPSQSSNFPQGSDPRGSTSMSLGRSGQSDDTSFRQPTREGGLPQGAAVSQAPGLSEEKPTSDQSSGPEMDWDTALDTILKTLRKDKVGEK